MNGLQGLVDCLEHGTGAVDIDPALGRRALRCIDRMLSFTSTSASAAASTAASAAASQSTGMVAGIGAA